jgi:hypothetical protein
VERREGSDWADSPIRVCTLNTIYGNLRWNVRVGVRLGLRILAPAHFFDHAGHTVGACVILGPLGDLRLHPKNDLHVAVRAAKRTREVVLVRVTFGVTLVAAGAQLTPANFSVLTDREALDSLGSTRIVAVATRARATHRKPSFVGCGQCRTGKGSSTETA